MSLSEREQYTLEQLEGLIRRGLGEQEAARRLRVMLGRDGELADQMLGVRRRIARERFQITRRRAVVDLEDGPQGWYTGPSPDDLFWPRLLTRLETDPVWAPAVPALDLASSDVVGLLADPHSARIRTRGLVVGHVQSGKTANFTATIAKAADAGYRLFIVLSGVHNALRRQTQLRLEEHLCSLQPARWLQLTQEDRDFGNPVKALPLVTSTDLRLLAVVKKNVSRLTRLRDWLMQAHQHGGLDVCPVLIIDDEADQASPNSARNAELDRTRINELITELLTLPRVAYVGYTATPFANVLINPSDAMDLYPRSFIYSLAKPGTYFGAEELFGSDDDETDDAGSVNSTPHDMVRIVPDAEAALHRPQRGAALDPAVTESLREAIQWFIMATAARRARSGARSHSSMLIHTTHRVDPQLRYIGAIRATLDDMRLTWRGEKGEWQDLWDREASAEPAERHGLEPLQFSEVATGIEAVLGDARVVADNSRSTERLIYSSDPATVIAVGGNTLSRGLTLEGLVSSFFLRTSGAYDSLLQMGRWFGYRSGYSDLPRIWTTRDLLNDFEFLSRVESELRREIDRYGIEGTRPSEVGVRILAHPRMKVTSDLRMQFAVSGDASFGGQRPQVTYFNLQDETVRSNQLAVERLAKSFLPEQIEQSSDGRIVVRDVDVAGILALVQEYRFHERTELSSESLVRYIERQRSFGALTTWSVVIVGRSGGARRYRFTEGMSVPLLARSRLKRSSDSSVANIGTLMSRPDRVADLLSASDAVKRSDSELLELRTNSGRALLLVYAIDRDSQPKASANGYRESLGAVADVLALAFSFPGAVPGSEPKNTVQVDPARLTDFTGEYEEYIDEEGDQDEVDLSVE